MKAILHTKYGPPDFLEFKDVEKPTPNEDQVLIRVHAASVNAADYRIMRANPFLVRLMGGGFLKPKDPRFGSDVAGTVEAIGENIAHLKLGEEVFGCASGAFGEYALAKPNYVVPKPAGVSFEEVAAIPVAALTALQGLRDAGQIRSGQKVLIQGASGGVGIFAAQLAKSFGAEVTAVCSTRNLEMARSLGAAHVVDYTREDFTKSGKKYDLIFAVNGYHPIFAYKRALCPHGIYVCAGGTMPQLFQAILLGSFLSEKEGRQLKSMGIAKVNPEDLTFLGKLLETGKIFPVIDKKYPLNETAEAIRYVEEKHARGKVVISVS